MPDINREALIELVRSAMGSGVLCFSARARAGEVNLSAPIGDAFGSFPTEWVDTRFDLVDALTKEVNHATH